MPERAINIAENNKTSKFSLKNVNENGPKDIVEERDISLEVIESNIGSSANNLINIVSLTTITDKFKNSFKIKHQVFYVAQYFGSYSWSLF